MLLALHSFLSADIHAPKKEGIKFAKETAGNAFVIPLKEIFLSEIGAYDHTLAKIDASVDDVVKRGNGKLIG